MIILQNPEDFQKITAAEGIVLVQFGSQTCAPCGAIQEKMDYWRSRHSGTEFLYVPSEHFQPLCSQEGILSVPVVQVYVNGKLTIQEAGIFSINDLMEKVNRYYSFVGKADN